MNPLLDTLAWQFRMTWSLAEHYLPHLTDELCTWMPAPSAFTVRLDEGGTWVPDWSKDETYPPPTVSIAWSTWHIQWWWTSALAAARAEAIPERESVPWSGTADGVRAELTRLAAEWRGLVADLSDDDLERPVAFPWPEPRPLRMMVAWVNSELMKNIAEIGDAVRQYHATRQK